MDPIANTQVKVGDQIEYLVKGRILHATARGPFSEVVATIPVIISEFIPRLAQQGKWGQIVIFQKSALISAPALEEFATHLRLRYQNPQTNPVTALVFEPDVEGGHLMAPKYLQCYQEAGVESRIFEEYSSALDWVESRIRQVSARIEWKDSYKTGDVAIDEQHQELFKRAAYVIAATSHEGQVITSIRLFQYMRTHLSHEEDLMRRYQYPDLNAHARQHQEMISRLNQISKKIANENLVKVDLEEFIEQFLTHMETMDSKLAEYVKSR